MNCDHTVCLSMSLVLVPKMEQKLYDSQKAIPSLRVVY